VRTQASRGKLETSTAASRFLNSQALQGVAQMAHAYRRVQKLVAHLSAIPFNATHMQNMPRLALVPKPGTWEYEQWLSTLRSFPNNTAGGRLLVEWIRFFQASGPSVNRALRRFLVISAHLTAPAYPHTLQIIEVN